MKSPVAAGVVLALMLSASPLLAAKTNMKAMLEGSSAGSAATGTGNFTYDDVTRKLCGKVTFMALESGAVTGAVLKNVNDGALVKTLTPGPSPLSVNVTLTVNEGAVVINPGLYIAIQTVGNPAPGNGEINGELLEDAAGVEQVCTGGVTDAGADSGGVDSGTSTSSSSSGSTSSSSGDTTSSSSSGDTGEEEEEEKPAKKPAKKDDGGCSTTGETTTGGVALAALVALVVASRRPRKR